MLVENNLFAPFFCPVGTTHINEQLELIRIKFISKKV